MSSSNVSSLLSDDKTWESRKSCVSSNRTQKCELFIFMNDTEGDQIHQNQEVKHTGSCLISPASGCDCEMMCREVMWHYTAIMQWSIEWSVIRQSSQTFLPNSHTDLAEYCRVKHSRSLVFSSLNNICKKATVNNAMSIQVYVTLKQVTHNSSEDTFQNRWTYIFDVHATKTTTKKQARCAYNTIKHFGCRDNYRTTQIKLNLKSTMYNEGM